MPIILCTGYSELINETQAIEMGISEFVMKPYTVANFANTIRKALKTHRRIYELRNSGIEELRTEKLED
jgi:DNA-binding NtrC family response regulator